MTIMSGGFGLSGNPESLIPEIRKSGVCNLTVISNNPKHHFTPSNPWVAVGWRTRKDISFALGPVLAKKGIEFVQAAAGSYVPPAANVLTARLIGQFSYVCANAAPLW